MGQFFTPIPVPSGVAFRCAPLQAAFASKLNDVKLNPPFLSSSRKLRSFPSTLLNQAIARQNVAGQGRLAHVE
ncbi:hypothetical protein BS639_01295 [Rouxiella silvae]|uniref:Uncharacterized protein n=1 Tax=Rouxiella silvae TaxID=1646373 RepID=A0ABX3U6Y9_9GAMM|nr:hypothetical protein GA565_16960 [Rouxiella sp. S1S-2]KQN42871.1 hypothetical protein ASE93_19430 [Serratia sp. Leaf50]ORJ23016.1 hypothetical protein BS639_01295 [Rouxiella silvae]